MMNYPTTYAVEYQKYEHFDALAPERISSECKRVVSEHVL